MRLLRSGLPVAALAIFLLAAGTARGQEPTVIKYPGGPEVIAFGPGQFQAFAGAKVRWTVVYDNTVSPFDVTFNYLDVMDPAGLLNCDGSPVCPGARHLELLCTGADAPDPSTGTVDQCDPALGRLDIRSVTVPAGGVGCLQFSTLILDGARTGGAQNIGCVSVILPSPVNTRTRPTTSQTPTCPPVPSSGLTTGCSNIFVPNVAPPNFSNRKTATVDDTNANGVTDVGDVITWTVEVTNNSADPHDGWIYDPIPAGSTFVDILDNPGGACAFDGGVPEVACTVLNFASGETKTLRFRTAIDCSVFTDDDTSRVCNTSFLCNDAGRLSCAPSDEDLTSPVEPTCVVVPQPDLTASTKTWSIVDDRDGDGALSDGDIVGFAITVRNDGSGTATNVVVTDVLDVTCLDEGTVDAGAGFYDPATDTITWPAGDLATGEAAFTVITAAILDTGAGCCNQAGATHDERVACTLPLVVTNDPATAAPGDPTCVQFGPQPILDVDKDFALTNDVNGDGVIDPGDALTFTITVRNMGSGVATDVVVDDIILPCWDGFVSANVVITPSTGGTNESTDLTPPATPARLRVTGVGGAGGLAPLGAEVVTITFDLIYAPGSAGACCNEADVTYAESAATVSSDDPTTGLTGDATCTSRGTFAATLEIGKTATEEFPDGCWQPGENITFTLTVTARSAEALLIEMTDTITDPSGVFTIVNPGSGTPDAGGDSITWIVGDVDVDATRTLTWIGRFDCTATAGMFAEDVATASASNAPTASSPVVTTTVGESKLTVTKAMSYTDRDASGSFSPGDEAIFDITVENVGDCPALSVVIVDTLDADLDYTSVSADGAPLLGGDTLTWDETTTPALASLASGSSVTYSVRALVLEPGPTNPNPGFDGVVENTATASASGSRACPIRATSNTVSDVIDVSTAFFELQLTSADDDLDTCHERGEPLTIDIELTPRGGAADNAVLTLAVIEAMDLMDITDADGGTVAGNPETITWNLGRLPVDRTVRRRVMAAARCDVPDAQSFDLRADATSSSVPAEFAELLALRTGAPVLEVTKRFSWLDDGDATLEVGETVKYDITVSNVGSCQVRNMDVIDAIDVDLDATAPYFNPVATFDGVRTLIWSGLGLDPGASIGLTFEVPVLDPATNPDPMADGFLSNEATAVANSIHGCPTSVFQGAAPVIEIGTMVGTFRLLRNDFITCREDAFDTMKAELLRPRPVPQECSNPPAIDPAHRGTQVVDNVTSPYPFAGDADTASSFEQCPQTLVGFGRILVLYELDDPDPACVRTLRVRKVGRDIEISW